MNRITPPPQKAAPAKSVRVVDRAGDDRLQRLVVHAAHGVALALDLVEGVAFKHLHEEHL